ncbi:class I SAM-dependent methyltransferase [Loktanella sp. IMCC34160]|uniref:class I SAM-dependent methyltransferase n=1 Tax=Loktanella sp. IMCC34160 TaxID=2510646 RepID=UPI0013EDA86B|nr:class I SAM-dependent methyltransferase [Loktanella sp. IMCC34160]
MSTSDSFAKRYQSVLVPVIFEPWARELVARVGPRPGDHVLDLACGTGAVTREVAKQTPDVAKIVAADHSSGMLGVARSQSQGLSGDVDWIEADAANLPFSENRFDLAYCQQALQFFPDRPKALSELRRVLKPKAPVAFCVQRELAVNPLLKAQAEALDAHVGKAAADAVRAICSLPDREDLRALFENAGFEGVQIESVTLMLSHPDVQAFTRGALGGMHTGDKLSGLGNDQIERAIEAFVAGLDPFVQNGAMLFPHTSHVVVATA